MTWSKAARDAAIAARRSKAKGTVAQQAAAKIRSGTAARTGLAKPSQLGATLNQARALGRQRGGLVTDKSRGSQSGTVRASAGDAILRGAGKPKVAGTGPKPQRRTAFGTGLYPPSREAGAEARGRRKETAMHREMRTTDRTRGSVAGSTRLRRAQQKHKAGIAVAKSQKGAAHNRYAPQNTGGIKRSSLRK